jgi:hypothetical protein
LNKINNNEIDVEAVRELELFATNTQSIYNSKHMPFVRNYKRKIAKGIFNEDLALKGIVNNYVPVVISEYRNEFGLSPVNNETKIALAKELLALVLQDCNEVSN